MGSRDVAYQPNADQSEALARLEYLVMSRARFSLLEGPSSSGKSVVLDMLADRLRNRGIDVGRLDLAGVTLAELPVRLLQQLGSSGRDPTRGWSTWRRIERRLIAGRSDDRPAALLLDHLDCLASTITVPLRRLVHLGDGSITVIVASRSMPGDDLAGWSDLRVELASLVLDRTAAGAAADACLPV